ncbi:MAG: hypothetical protein NTW82_07705 [Bacteroidia bacterium]|nr:hypothetical protein [Bacteroidia bacterium]
MRKTILLTFLSAVCMLAFSQVPQGINYQAVVYNSSGSTVPNTNIQVKAAILSDTLTPVIVWEELHSTVRTNASGVFNLVIGTGTKQSGSASAFNTIDWSMTPLYLKIQIFYQSAWKYMGTSKLWSVPYAMYSGNKVDLTDLQTEIDATETVLRAEIDATETVLQTEIDATETGAGLNNNGSYSANASANYIASASSLKDADNKLDAQAKKNSDNIAAIKNLC